MGNTNPQRTKERIEKMKCGCWQKIPVVFAVATCLGCSCSTTPQLMKEDVESVVFECHQRAFEGQTRMVGFGWWSCAKLWYNGGYEAVAQLQDQPVLPSDQPHCQPCVLPE